MRRFDPPAGSGVAVSGWLPLVRGAGMGVLVAFALPRLAVIAGFTVVLCVSVWALGRFGGER